MSKSIREYLIAGVAQQAGVEAIIAELNEAREGMYTCAVKAACVAADKGEFMAAADKLMSDFRKNARGIAVKFNMVQAKTTDGKLKTDSDGNPQYTVPSSLSTAKSVIGKAFDRKIKFGTEAKPESFTAIREANKLAKDEESHAALTGDDKRRADARVLLTQLDTALDALSGKALTALIKLIKAVCSAKAVTDEAKKSSTKKA